MIKSMKRTAITMAAVCFMLIFLVPQAHALRAVSAQIVSGQVQVIGTQAASNANIIWQGNIVTQANPGGTFQFSTTELPPTCVGTLSDGVSAIQVVVRGCESVVGAISPTYKATGQAYSVHADDDGALQRGAPRRYQDLGLTVLDLDTGLEWEKKCSSCGGNHDVTNNYDWYSGIWTWLAAVNAENGVGYTGHNDWRIPNINELLTLVNYGISGYSGPSTDTVFNNGTNSFTGQYYWSSTSYALSPSNIGWTVDFHGGWSEPGDKNATYISVRAVRGP
jgi:uncharacterized protein YceK